ncbi:MAG: DNA-processing protein DprA [Planctomycetota bacterium]
MGPKRIHRLREAMGSAQEVLCNPLVAACAVEPRILRMQDRTFLERAAAEQQLAAKACGARTLFLGEPEYPEVFHDLQEPPPVLHVLGKVELLAGRIPRTSVIGARACTPYGREQARRFGKGLAFAGEILVSGAARGIDQIAMKGAVEAEGPTIAVLGSGLDHPYPKESIPLLGGILEQNGAVVSEFPFGTAPKAGHFPRRNRLIAALGRATLVIQATTKSGTMNTVDWALGLGREVFALPGPVDDVACSGTNRMLREGAGLALGPEEMLCDLDRNISQENCREEPAVLQLLLQGDAAAGQLSARLGLAEEQLRMELTELELRGRVIRLPSGHYHRCGPRP